MWGSVDGDHVFPHFVGGLWQTDGVSLSIQTLLGNMEGAPLPGALGER